MKLLSTRCGESSDEAAFSALSAWIVQFRFFLSPDRREALALTASFRLTVAEAPGAVAPFDNLTQSLEARIAGRSRLEVKKNPRQRRARRRPIVNAFLGHPSRVADRSPHNVSNRCDHDASHFLSGATPEGTGQMWRQR
jgi:hypothetical protein